jgi:hypothetical protein
MLSVAELPVSLIGQAPVTGLKRGSGKPLLQTPVAVLAALGLAISGESWRAKTSADSYISLKRQVLTVSGSCWHNRRDGLKGRCSTTELRPCLLITSYIEKS